MRLILFLLMPLVLVLVFLSVTNFGENVTLTVWDTTYQDVPLDRLLFISFAAGAAFITIIAVAEGATIRLANRRLRRELDKLETENSFLRTQPPVASKEKAEAPPAVTPTTTPMPPEEPLPSAPVYGSGEAAEPD